MLQSVDLRDYMITGPIKVREDANLFDAMKAIIDNKVSGVCVINENKTLVGVLSEMDCLAAVLKATYNHVGVGAVREYMTKENLVVAHPNDDIIDVAQDMLLKKHRRRPVVENGELVGQVSCRQLLTAVNKFHR
ncbi:CBS domain-containing protein [Colwellia sp. MSW7]|jgi:CBS domain-containing protein|uniref:CBS domain-containing protein n=1 Tax=Colwellia maritima TaxID=2912588 RepID=A0ABS9WWB9_9GAMM|nr:CBS domain-containing protein [Colwellia maritima]MCI2282141.1 CBS domain-containing protein [Colwellia maritima]